MTADKPTVSEIRGHGAPAKGGVRIRLLLKDRNDSLWQHTGAGQFGAKTRVETIAFCDLKSPR